MKAGIQFTSYVHAAQRAALESLVFFNARQEKVLRGIVNAIEQFGPLKIVRDGDRLRVLVEGDTDVQTLFAVESSSGTPVGVVIYIRSDLERITVLHLGIAEEFTVEGRRADEHLLLKLLGELRRLSRRVKGVREIELYYLRERGDGSKGAVPRKLAL